MFRQTHLPSSFSFSFSSFSSSSPSPQSSLFFNPSPASFPLPLAPLQLPSPVPPALAYFDCSQVEREASMEEALKSCLRPQSSLYSAQQQSKGTVSEEGGSTAERGNLLGEGFSVDDLLNLGDYAENDKESEEAEAVVEGVEAKAGASEAEHREEDDSNTSSSSSSSSSSVLPFRPPQPPPPLSEISLPVHVAEELEWVSLIMEDSMSEFPQCPGGVHFPSAPPSQGQTETPAAAAAVEKDASFSSTVVCELSTEAMVPVKAKRSKRSRSAAAWSMSAALPFADSSSVTGAATSSSASSPCSSHTNPSTACLVYDRHPTASGDQSLFLSASPALPAKKEGPKKRGRKPKPPSSAAASGERRCSHCGAHKTPQWRAGPLGAKTLCNACGVRFKSGRLLPEYRPACSPTFVSHIHSNSHRKVLEMRREKEAEQLLLLSSPLPPVASF